MIVNSRDKLTDKHLVTGLLVIKRANIKFAEHQKGALRNAIVNKIGVSEKTPITKTYFAVPFIVVNFPKKKNLNLSLSSK